MDDELKAKLVVYLSEAEAAAKTGKDFLIEQAPLYVQELLAWEFWSAVMLASVAVVGVIVSVISLAVAAMKFDESDHSTKMVGIFVAGLLSLALLPISAVEFVQNAKAAVKVSVAPRVVIVEKLQESLK